MDSRRTARYSVNWWRDGESLLGCPAQARRFSPLAEGSTVEVVMRTQGEIEAAIGEGMARFEQEFMGRGPKDIHAHLIGDLLVVF